MNNKEKDKILIKFEDGDFSLDVNVSPDNETVWLSQEQIAELYQKSRSTITGHINNILSKGELIGSTSVRISDRTNHRPAKIYNLDMITAIGYRIKSSRTTKFKEWALNEIEQLKNQNSQKMALSQYILFNYDEIKLNVNVDPDKDTVWLNKNQLIILFNTTRQNLEYHINNIYSQNELVEEATCKKILQVQMEDNREVTRTNSLYNLDMIISLGFRINSKRGIIFRQWANRILKQYLLKGSVINEERCLSCTSNIISLQNKVENIESKINNLENDVYSENSKAFFEGEIVEPYTFIRHIFFLAKESLTITDFYADNYLISMLKDIKVNITIVTSSSSYLNKLDLPNNINVVYDNDIHGRYIFTDDKYVYALDNSFNNIGKKKFVIMKLDNITKEMLLQGRKAGK